MSDRDQDPGERASDSEGEPPARSLWTDATQSLAPESLRWLACCTEKALAALDARGELRVRVVGDGEMSRAHEQYSGVAGTTDVLTFDLRSDPDHTNGAPLDTDALVCIDEATRQSNARGHGVREELLLYALHAALHCLGHDDRDEQDAARMHAAEDELLAAIGLDAIYARPEAQPETQR